MSTDIKSDPEAPAEPVEGTVEPTSEPAEANPKVEGASEQRPPPQWEYRTEFRINTQMREVLNLARKVTEAEIERLRRKVEKLTYGS